MTAARGSEMSVLGRTSAILAGIGYGSLGIFSRLVYEEGGEPYTLLLLRFACASAIFLSIAFIRGRPFPTRREIGLCLVLGAATLAATFSLFAGFEVASPGLVALLFYIYPLIVTVGGHLLFGEILTRSRILLLVAGLVGIALTVGTPGSANVAGILWGLAAGASLSVFILGGRHLMSGTVDSVQFVSLAFTGATVIMLALAPLAGLHPIPEAGIKPAIALILLSTVSPTLLFYFAVRRIGAGPASRLATIEPVTAVVLSYVVLGEAIAAGQILGGTLVVTAVVLLASPPGSIRRLVRRALGAEAS